MSTKRVIGYARLSMATEDSTSIDRQREIIEQTSAARGYTLVGVEVDEDVSATLTRLDRPGLKRVREAIRLGEAEAVMVWRLDRLARSVVDFGTLLDEGVQVISATEPLDTTTPMGRAMAEILQVFAALESKTIGARVASSIDFRLRNARWKGGQVPYGYRVQDAPDRGKVLVINPEEAAIVREVADRLLAGESLYRVAQDLNKRGVSSRRGKGWTPEVLRGMVTKDWVLGRQVHRGQVMRDEDGMPRQLWPALLPLEDVEALRAVFPPTGRKPRRKRIRLLSGVIVCSSCRIPLVGRINSRGVAMYACQTRNRGMACNYSVAIKSEPLEEYLVSEYLDAVGWMPEARAVERRKDAAEVAAVEEAIRDTAMRMIEVDADVSALAGRLEELRRRRSELAAMGSEVVVEEVRTGRTIAEAWEAADTDMRRAMLRSSLLGPVIIHPGRRSRYFDPGRVEAPWAWREPAA